MNHSLPGHCRICATVIEPFMSFGRMPIANGFLSAEEISNEYFFELAPAFCDSCGMFQIMEQPRPEKMFHEQYAFFSSTSRYMQLHFQAFANRVMKEVLDGPNPLVVELGSNDGIMLRHFHASGFRHLGVEPSANVAEIARSHGIHTIGAFFNRQLADDIISEHGQADVILAANVMCHISDLSGVAAGVQQLLKPEGVFVFEDPYLGDMIAKTSYDQIYDEHVFIFSVNSVMRAFAEYGLELTDVAPQITHGGSMRYTFAPKGKRQVSSTVRVQLEKERAQGLDKVEAYQRFKKNCESSARRPCRRWINYVTCQSASSAMERHQKARPLPIIAASLRTMLSLFRTRRRSSMAGFRRGRTFRLSRMPTSCANIPTTRCYLLGITPPKFAKRSRHSLPPADNGSSMFRT